MGTSAYKKCPRCELNYIKADEELCDVCKAELKLAPNIFIDEEDELEDMVLCPICKKNYINYDEDMCQSCRDKLDEVAIEEEDDDENWRAYLDDDKPVEIPDEENLLSLTELEEEESEFIDEEEEVTPVPDVEDFDEVIDDEFEDDDEEDDEEEDEDNF